MMPLAKVPPYDKKSSRKNQSILISTDAIPPSGREPKYRRKGDRLNQSGPNAGILTSKSQDLNLVRTDSGSVDEISSNTQAISFENEAVEVQSITTQVVILGL